MEAGYMIQRHARLNRVVWEKAMTKNKQQPERYVPPTVAKVGHFSKDTDGTVYTLKDATTLGFKKPK